MSGITIDGIEYAVRIKYETLERDFAIMEGNNSGVSITGRTIPDVYGTKYAYSVQVEPNPSNPSAYDAFYEKISEPVDYHTVVLPYGQSTMTFQARILSGKDVFTGMMGGYNRWKGLSVTFSPIEPQRTV